MGGMRILSGTSNRELAEKVARVVGSKLTEVEISRFASGEARVWVKEEVKGKEVVVVQSFGPREPDRYVVEFGLLVDAVRRAGARRVRAVVPWLGYAVQDKVFRDGEPLSAKLIAKWIEAAGVDELTMLDLHSDNIVGYYNIPVTHLSADELFSQVIRRDNKLSDLIVVAADFGAVKRSDKFAGKLGVGAQVVIEKFRSLTTGEVQIRGISGESVVGKTAVVFDDFIGTGGTLVVAAELLKEKGAVRVVVAVTHGVGLADEVVSRRIEKSRIDKLYVTDSVALPEITGETVEVISVAELMTAGLK